MKLFNKNVDEPFCRELAARLYSDVNSNILSNKEKYLVLFWINNVHLFLSNKNRYRKILKSGVLATDKQS